MRKLFLFIVLIIVSVSISSTIYADTIYTIKKGDNPSSIAKKFKVSVKDIMNVNNLKPHNLKPGTKITIPSHNKEAHHKPKPGKKHDRQLNMDTVNLVESQEDALHHVVKKGDTLSAISKKYSVSISELKELNNLSSTKLKPGQQLSLKRIGPKTYMVRKGDTIHKIARKFNIGVDELKDINSLETDSLHPGQKLLLEPEEEINDQKTNAMLSHDVEINHVASSEEVIEMSLQDRLILFAKKMLNIPYRFGGSSLMGIDCSAYVQKVYSFFGIDLPRSAREQFRVGEIVPKDELTIGDLVFFRTYASFPSHVGIYLGNDLFIHASSKDRKVTINSLNTPYYLKRFIGAKRLLTEDTDIKVD